MMGFKAFVGVALVCLSAIGHSAVIHVKADSTGSPTGTSWATAINDLQIAIANAEWGDEIWVAAGNYKPTSGTTRSATFRLPSGVKLYGGFAGWETSKSQRDWRLNESILSGEIGTPALTDNIFQVVTGGFSTHLDGFVVEYGYSTSTTYGGGLTINDSNPATLVLRNCTFRYNTSGRGGAMHIIGGSPVIDNCLFTSNTSPVYGGALYLASTNPTFTNTTFQSNRCDTGGMMYISSGNPVFTRCIITDNKEESGGGSGGAIYIFGGAPKFIDSAFYRNRSLANGGVSYGGSATTQFINCVFTGNTAGRDGGALWGSPTVINCTFTLNEASRNGGALFGAPKVSNSILWNNTAGTAGNEVQASGTPTFRHCNIRASGGSAAWNASLGTNLGGNIVSNPQFYAPEIPAGPDGLWFTTDDGLLLNSGSPSIDTADNALAPELDILRRSRRGNGAEMGAYEFYTHQQTATGSAWIGYR